MTMESYNFKLIQSDPKKPVDEKIAKMLDGTPLFSDFKFDEIRIAAKFMEAYISNAGKVLFREGEIGGFISIVIDGKVDVMKQDLHQREKIVATLGTGKVLGEMALIDEEPRSATCIVKTEATLVIFSHENFKRFLNECPKLGVKLLFRLCQTMSQRLRQTSGMLVEFLQN